MWLWVKRLCRIALCALVVLLFTGAATAASRQAETGGLERQANQTYDDGDTEAAMALCEQAIGQDPKDKNTAQPPAPTHAALEALFDTAPFDRFVQETYPQDAGHAKSGALTVPEDLDGDGLDEVVYRLGEEGLLYLRMREGKAELACPRIDFRGYFAASAEIVEMQDTESQYILLHLGKDENWYGFWLMRISDGVYEFVEYSSCYESEGKSELTDSDGDGRIDSYDFDRVGPEVYGGRIRCEHKWSGDRFKLTSSYWSDSESDFDYADPEQVAWRYLMLKALGTQYDLSKNLEAVLDVSSRTVQTDTWDTSLLAHFHDAWYKTNGYDMAITESSKPQQQGRKQMIVTLRKEMRGIAQIAVTLVLVDAENRWLVTDVKAEALDPADAG